MPPNYCITFKYIQVNEAKKFCNIPPVFADAAMEMVHHNPHHRHFIIIIIIIDIVMILSPPFLYYVNLEVFFGE